MEIVCNGVFLDVDKNESIPLNYSISDIADIASRSTDYSKTFTLEGTAKNNLVFGHFYEPSKFIGKELSLADSTDNMFMFFNPQKTIAAEMFINNVLILEGYLKLLKVHSTNGVIRYDVIIYGKLGDLFNNLRNPNRLLLSDLDLGDPIEYTNKLIGDSHTNYGSENVTFPYINYGNNILPQYPYFNVRPAFKVLHLIDLIFSKSKYTYNCPFFSTAFFNRLHIPNNQERLSMKGKDLVSKGTIVANSITGGINNTIENVSIINSNLKYFTTSNNEEFEYINTTSNKVDISVTLNAVIDVKKFLGVPLEVSCAILLNGNFINQPTNGVSFVNDFTGSITIEVKDLTLSAGDIIKVEWNVAGNAFIGSSVDYTNVGSFSIASQEIQTLPITFSDNIILNEVIPQGVYCDDFLTSILKMFNLYVRPSKTISNQVDILTYDEFYSLTDYEDWTLKVDNINYELTPTINELPSIYNFNYKSDNDHLNDEYKKKFNEGYGDLKWNNSLGDKEENIELIFSATPDYAETNDELITSGIFKLNKSDGKMSATSSNIRIVQLRQFDASNSNEFTDNQPSDLTANSVVNNESRMILASMWDNPLIPNNGTYFESLCFASPNELYYNTGANSTFSVGLYSAFYSQHVAELTDASSFIITCNIQLNEMDIHNLDFRKYKVIEGVLYKLLSITDFDINNNKLAKCTLIKVIDL